jgi:pimeloyl-ACP methyl ester carboxylesterase
MPELLIGNVPTWYETIGSGSEDLVLLHGGLSSSEALSDVFAPLRANYRVTSFDRRGHGRTPDTPADFHYESMADETIAILEHLGTRAHLVGTSDGGVVAAITALRRPELVDRLVLIGANFHYDGLAHIEIEPGDPTWEFIASRYAAISPDGLHHFGVVAEKSFAMFAREPTMTQDDISKITAPTLVIVGDDDAVRLAHTVALYEALPNGQLCVMPGASHFLPMEKPEETVRIILGFLHSDAQPETLFPIRRK